MQVSTVRVYSVCDAGTVDKATWAANQGRATGFDCHGARPTVARHPSSFSAFTTTLCDETTVSQSHLPKTSFDFYHIDKAITATVGKARCLQVVGPAAPPQSGPPLL